MHAVNFMPFLFLGWFRFPVVAQWTPNVPAETRPLAEMYQAAQVKNCVLRVAAGGDGTTLHDLDKVAYFSQPGATGLQRSQLLQRDFRP